MPRNLILLLAISSFLPIARAQIATTKPVGYETLAISPGYSYLGIRLQAPPVASGTIATINANQLTDPNANFTALAAQPTKKFIVEFATNPMTVQIIFGSAGSGTTLALPADLTATVSTGTAYTIRPVATLASVFGPANSASLTPGYSGPAKADVLYVRNGDGSQTGYFYDADRTSWADAKTNATVDPVSVFLISLDGIRLFSQTTTSVLVLGEVKTKPVATTVAPGFNYMSSHYPVRVTLATALNASLEVIHQGQGNSQGADVIYVPGPEGATRYYYDANRASWINAETDSTVDPTTVLLPSGFLYFNSGPAISIQSTPPEGYSNL